MEEQIVFETDEGEVLFYVIEETRVNGTNYLLVTDSEEEEADAYILKDTSSPEDREAVYEMVEDEEIQKVMAGSSDLEDKAKELIEEANSNGGKDNIAVVIVKPDADEV